jgi:hypothetical protein
MNATGRLRRIAGKTLVVLGHILLIVAAILVPVAFAADLIDTFPALGLAALVILAGTLLLLGGDRLADGPPVRRSVSA